METIRIKYPEVPVREGVLKVGKELNKRANELGYNLFEREGLSGKGKDYDRTAKAKLERIEDGYLHYSVWRASGRTGHRVTG